VTSNNAISPARAGRRTGTRVMTAIAAAGVLFASACSSSSSSGSGATSAPATPGSSSSAAAGVDPAAAALLPAAIKSSGVLNDGVNLPNPPLEYQNANSNNYTGFDVDLARALAAKLGLKVDFVNLAFTSLLTSLDTGRVDIVLSGLFDTPTRAAKYTIINYLNTGTQIFTVTANSSKAPSPPSLCGQTVETAIGTAFIQQLHDLSAKMCAGKSPITVLAVGGSFAEEVLQVKTGRAVAAVATPDNIAYSITTTPHTYVTVGKPFDQVPYGIDVVKSNTGLVKALQVAFKDILADGTYAQIAAKYNLKDGAVSSVVVKGGM
jgi:polar amino acid transport system substrate-binding protein